VSRQAWRVLHDQLWFLQSNAMPEGFRNFRVAWSNLSLQLYPQFYFGGSANPTSKFLLPLFSIRKKEPGQDRNVLKEYI
jgi:hypothetical protein